MSKFEDFLEKAGLLVQDEEVKDKNEMQNNGQENKGNTFQFSSNQKSEGGFSSDVISRAYSTLPKSEEDIVDIIEKLIENFKMLPDEQKPAVIVGTLQTMGKDVPKFITEAETKKIAIANEFTKYSEEITGVIKQLDSEISNAEQEISRCKQEQLNRNNDLENQKKAVAEEVKRLDKIIKILGGK